MRRRSLRTAAAAVVDVVVVSPAAAAAAAGIVTARWQGYSPWLLLQRLPWRGGLGARGRGSAGR
jgi:hypothetical protein